MEYQRYIRNRQIERAKKLLKNLDPETYKKGPHDVTRFIKRTSSTKSGEKITDQYTIDQSVIEEEEKYDGFYAVATNLDDSAKDILEVSANRYKIEDCFRMMKTNFSARPVFHQKRERIIAHFMICYTALLIYRLMEKKLDLHGTHYTADTLIETMKSMDVANIEDMCYMSTYTSSEACTALNAITGLGLDKKYYSLFGKVFLLYINSFLYVFHHFYSFFHNGEFVLLNDYTQFVKLRFLKGYFTWMVR